MILGVGWDTSGDVGPTGGAHGAGLRDVQDKGWARSHPEET